MRSGPVVGLPNGTHCSCADPRAGLAHSSALSSVRARHDRPVGGARARPPGLRSCRRRGSDANRHAAGRTDGRCRRPACQERHGVCRAQAVRATDVPCTVGAKARQRSHGLPAMSWGRRRSVEKLGGRMLKTVTNSVTLAVADASTKHLAAVANAIVPVVTPGPCTTTQRARSPPLCLALTRRNPRTGLQITSPHAPASASWSTARPTRSMRWIPLRPLPPSCLRRRWRQCLPRRHACRWRSCSRPKSSLRRARPCKSSRSRAAPPWSRTNPTPPSPKMTHGSGC